MSDFDSFLPINENQKDHQQGIIMVKNKKSHRLDLLPETLHIEGGEARTPHVRQWMRRAKVCLHLNQGYQQRPDVGRRKAPTRIVHCK